MKYYYIGLVASYAANVFALGINCHGSGECSFCRAQTNLKELQQACNNIDDNTYYQNGQQICCTECDDDNTEEFSVCAILQYTSNGAPGHSIKSAIQSLIDHKCGLCGSFPFYHNDVYEGELTVNVMDYTTCNTLEC
ncbi:hypothetical protein NQ176_g5350 [Zarea fungicola]|uniref:Uncharacterized protein n=1 Tax=Zarea fungicola TaxID=93591 RepID=A0ACC1N8Z5_9HYPO|nr:hypothetical protein NQ176_g5350 [Lecanicillium fungicola]